jgi:tRNA(His) 5'-end guanylyltransferase
MNETAMELCKKIPDVQIAYVQSDEITLLIHNYKTHESQPWFAGKIQKMASIASSIASAYFTANSWKLWDKEDVVNKATLIRAAQFDARVFVLPENEVCNNFIWRQQDATRNSVQMLARSLYSHKELNFKNNSELQEMCHQKGINWNYVPTQQKRGRCIVRELYSSSANADSDRSWIVDMEIPIFSQDRNYIEQHLATYQESAKD